MFLGLHLGWKTSAQASGRETLLPPMYNTCTSFKIMGGWADGDDQHHGEADDGEGHDKQGDADDQAPGGELSGKSHFKRNWREERNTWGCRPGLQDLWQCRAPSATGGAGRSSTPPSMFKGLNSSCTVCYWTMQRDQWGKNWRWPWQGEGSTSRREQNSCSSFQICLELCRVTRPPSTRVQRQLKGFVS